MIFDIPNNKSVIIFSNPRTGSHAVSETIYNQLNGYTLFNEPSFDKKNLNRFLIFQLTKKPYVLKEHSLRFYQTYPNDFVTDQHFIIRLRRKNIINQILSNYIARYRKGWVKFSDDHVAENIPLDEKRLLEDLDWINMYNTETNRLPYKIDLEIYFEDMTFAKNLNIRPSPKPLNESELKEWAYEVLKDRV